MASTTLQLGRTLDSFCRQRANDGLGVVDLSVLRQLERGVELPSRVARALRLDPGRVTRIIDQLVSLQYVEREPDNEDRRRCKLHLTGIGQTRLNEGKRTLTAGMTEMLDGLSVDQREDLQRGLDAVRRVLDASVAV